MYIVAPGTGRLDEALTNLAVAIRNNEMIADILAPRVGAARKTDKYWVFGKEWRTTQYNDKRATGAPAERIRIALSTDSYFCRSHALAAEIADEDRQGYEAGDLEQDAVQAMMGKIQLQREKDLAAMLADTAQVTNNVTLAGVSQWSDYVNSDPISDVTTAHAFIRNNTGVIAKDRKSVV